MPEGTERTLGSCFAEGRWRSETRMGPTGKVGAYHRTLGTYLNALADAGLMLARATEPSPTGSLADSPSLSGLARPIWEEVPAILVARCGKAAQGRCV